MPFIVATINLFLSLVHRLCISENTLSTLALWDVTAKKTVQSIEQKLRYLFNGLSLPKRSCLFEKSFLQLTVIQSFFLTKFYANFKTKKQTVTPKKNLLIF